MNPEARAAAELSACVRCAARFSGEWVRLLCPRVLVDDLYAQACALHAEGAPPFCLVAPVTGSKLLSGSGLGDGGFSVVMAAVVGYGYMLIAVGGKTPSAYSSTRWQGLADKPVRVYVLWRLSLMTSRCP